MIRILWCVEACREAGVKFVDEVVQCFRLLFGCLYHYNVVVSEFLDVGQSVPFDDVEVLCHISYSNFSTNLRFCQGGGVWFSLVFV
jgi:hypothetical protein